MRHYLVASWDHEVSDWHVEAEGPTLMRLRPHIRDLLDRGYDWDLSILVERTDGRGLGSRVRERRRRGPDPSPILLPISTH